MAQCQGRDGEELDRASVDLTEVVKPKSKYSRSFVTATRGPSEKGRTTTKEERQEAHVRGGAIGLETHCLCNQSRLALAGVDSTLCCVAWTKSQKLGALDLLVPTSLDLPYFDCCFLIAEVRMITFLQDSPHSYGMLLLDVG